MGTLADIGRSRAGSDLANFIVSERQRKVSNLREQERTAAYTQNLKTRSDINENALRQMREKRIVENKRGSIKVLTDQFEVKAVRDYARKLAQAYNYVDENGTIRRKDWDEIIASLKSPMHMPNISDMRLQDATKKYDVLLKASKDPTGKAAKELGIKQEEIQKHLKIAATKLNAVQGSHAGYMESIKGQADLLAKQAQLAKANQEKTPTTAMAAFLKNNPNATNEEIAAYQQTLFKPSSGTSLEVTPEGAVTFNQGNVPATKTMQTTIQKDLKVIDNSIGRVKNIIGSYRTDFQTLGTRWQNMWTAGKEKFGLGKKPTGAEKKELADITKFRTESINNINEEIHRLTGAQMSRWEARRITKGLPNPGTGFFDGDSPTEFETKLSLAYQNLLKVKARLLYYQREGTAPNKVKKLINSGKAITLDEVMKRIDERGAELEAALKTKDPDMKPNDVRKTVEGILAKEFGWEF